MTNRNVAWSPQDKGGYVRISGAASVEANTKLAIVFFFFKEFKSVHLIISNLAYFIIEKYLKYLEY